MTSSDSYSLPAQASPEDIEPKEWLFKKTLETFRELNLFEDASRIFFIYAHEPPGKDEVAKDFIQWFKDIRINIHSDQSPCGWGNSMISQGPSGTNTLKRERNILDNQLCLLPSRDFANMAEKVVLCCTETLAGYMAHTQVAGFVEDMKEKFLALEVRPQRPGETGEVDEATRKLIAQVRQKHATIMQGDFHHVQTELALFNLRDETEKRRSIVPLVIGGDFERCLPPYILEYDETIIRTTLNDQRSSQKCFFRLLEKVAATKKPVIDALKGVYDACSEFLDDEGSHFDPAKFSTYYEIKNLNALMGLRKDQNVVTYQKPIEMVAIHRALKEYYNGSLSVRRMSGQTLPVGSKFHNLKLVQRLKSEEQAGDRKNPSQNFIPLDGLFQERTLRDGTTGRPKRILIQGQPGVGKSTLCKQIVHTYLNDNALRNEFEWVLWVPLNRLELAGDLRAFFNTEYFQFTSLGRELADALEDRILGIDRQKTLLILDGWDETHGWTEHKAKLVAKLANHDPVIITSRHGGWLGEHVKSVDLELDVLGFDEASIKSYIEDPSIVPRQYVNDIKACLDKNGPVSDLAKLPICLDMLCYSWDELKRVTQAGSVPTLTMLYQAMMTKLWRRDALTLKKCDACDGSELTEEVVRAIRDPRRLERTVQAEVKLLCRLAIEMTEQNRINFESSTIDKIIQDTERQGKDLPLSLESNLNKLSLLHAHGRDSQSNYSFIHLTFQEFLAARWLIQNPTRIDLYIRNFKYHPRFESVWRFVTGLFSSSGDDEELYRFFTKIEEIQRDLLGPVHQRFVVSCLSEVPLSKVKTVFTPLREVLEEHLSEWVVFECEVHNLSLLARRPEFPKRILADIVRKSRNDEIKIAILDSLLESSGAPHAIIKMAMSWLGNSISNEKGNSISEELMQTTRLFLERFGRDLPSDGVKDLVDLMRDDLLSSPNENARALVSSVLGKAKLGPEDVDILKTMLCVHPDIQDVELKDKAAWVLRGQTELPLNVLHTLTKELALPKWDRHDPDRDGRGPIATALQGHCALPEEIQEELVEHLKSPNEFIGGYAAIALSRRVPFTNNILERLRELLRGPHPRVRHDALDALMNQTTLPETILEIVTDFLADSTKIVGFHRNEEMIRDDAVTALTNQSTLSPEILRRIIDLMIHSENDVRDAATKALRGRTTLPLHLLRTLMSYLNGEREELRAAALSILREQEDLLPEYLKELVNLFGSSNLFVMLASINIVCSQHTLPADVLKKFNQLLRNPNDVIKLSTLEALRSQHTLPPDVLKELERLLGDENQAVKLATLGVLLSQHTLPSDVLKKFNQLLRNPNEAIRLSTVEALRSQHTLPPDVLKELEKLLGDKNQAVKLATLGVLLSQHTLPGKNLYKMAEFLQDPASDNLVRFDVAYFLRHQAQLPRDLSQKLAGYLKCRNKDVRAAAANALGGRSTEATFGLPVQTLRILMELLRNPDQKVRDSAVYCLQGQRGFAHETPSTLRELLKDPDETVRNAAMSTLYQQSVLPDGDSFGSFDIGSEVFGSLYRSWLSRAFSEHLTWLVSTDGSHFDSQDASMNVIRNHLMATVNGFQTAFGVPPNHGVGVWSGSRFTSTSFTNGDGPSWLTRPWKEARERAYQPVSILED